MTITRRSVVLMLILVAAGCGSGGGGGDFNLMSLEQEWQLGEQLSRDIARQARLVNDPEALAYVNRVGRALVSSTEMGRLPWQFHIIADPNINAFNIPGGHVYVNTGLIAAADNASEFAGVLGHEISHGVERHATEQLTRAYGLEILASLLLGRDPGQLAKIATQILGTGALARFSREAEEEADQLGTRLMVNAGYDPRGMVTMFEELLQQRRARPNTVSQFFSTHPLTEDRIRSVSRQIEGLGARSGLRTDEPEYQRLRRSVS